MKPLDEAGKILLRQWLDKADKDLAVAKHLLNAGYNEAVGFHSQQAAEKYLKAYLVRRQVDFPKTHDLGKLLELVATVDARLAESLAEADDLTDFGVEIRYPGDLPELSADEAKGAVELAEKVLAAVSPALL